MESYNYFITGGTGTLGRETARQLLTSKDTGKIIIFSRDELKQKQMKSEFNDPRLQFVIGDVKDYDSLKRSVHGEIDYLFHFAALKHIDVCEENPAECLKTNFHGTQNVVNLVIKKNIRKMIFSSTDKAVNPINIYGMSKFMAEKMIRNTNQEIPFNRFLIFRWGNVLGSRGSLVDIVKENLEKKDVINIANFSNSEDVTRFFILIENAVQFMLSNRDSLSKQCLVPVMKGTPIKKVINAVAEALGHPSYRCGYYSLPRTEKAHEEMIFSGDVSVNSREVDQFSHEELLMMVKRCL